MILKWAGDGKAGAKARRRLSGCRDYCNSRGESINSVYHERNECDEFPFASTLDGGNSGVHKLCIVWWQNQLGGKLIQSYSALYKLQPDQEFIVRVIPGCGNLGKREALPDSSPWSKHNSIEELASAIERRATSWTATNSSRPFTVDRRPGSPLGSGFLVAPLEGVPAGDVSINLGPLGQATELSVTDGDGVEYLRYVFP